MWHKNRYAFAVNLTYAPLVVLLSALRKFASNLTYAPLATVLVFALNGVCDFALDVCDKI